LFRKTSDDKPQDPGANYRIQHACVIAVNGPALQSDSREERQPEVPLRVGFQADRQADWGDDLRRVGRMNSFRVRSAFGLAVRRIGDRIHEGKCWGAAAIRKERLPSNPQMKTNDQHDRTNSNNQLTP
jgi:hypothetical protein